MTQKHTFPRPIVQFRQLEGGLYGTLDLVAITRRRLELQLGADFVRFTREQAEQLRDAVQRFIDLDGARDDCDRDESDEDVVVASVVVEERSRGRAARRRPSPEPE